MDVTKKLILQCFKGRDLGPASMFLGMNIVCNKDAGVITLDQHQLAANIVEKAGMSECSGKQIPMAPGLKLAKGSSAAVDQATCPYAELVGSLLYLSTCTRPDIAYVTSCLSRFMSCPKEEHWSVLKGVIKYLSCTTHIGLVFGKDRGVVAYSDSDFAGDIQTRRSTTGYVVCVHGGPVAWKSRLQPTVAVSTCEAEYMAVGAAIREVVWLKRLLGEIGMDIGIVDVKVDNMSTVHMLHNESVSARTKHIDVQHHYSREKVQMKVVSVSHCPTSMMAADVLTKPLASPAFSKCLQLMGVMNVS